MAVRVELFGVARHRTGVEALDVDATTLGDALREARRVVPALGEFCLVGEALRPGYLANVNGLRFVSDSTTPLAAGDCLLILSADPGG